MRRTDRPWVAIIGTTAILAVFLFARGVRAAEAAVVAPAAPGEAQGYWLETSSGGSLGYGDVHAFPSQASTGSDACTGYGCVGIASSTSEGYWLADSSGTAGQAVPKYTGVLIPQGTVSTDNPQCNRVVSELNAPVVGVAGARLGAWLDASDGGVFALCGSSYFGSMGGRPLNAQVVGIAGTHDSNGYWEVAADGGVFSFGDAQFYGSMGGQHLNSPIVGMTSDSTGTGYWAVASDGGVFSFGTAPFLGSGVGRPPDGPIIGIAASPGPPTPV